MFKPLKDFIDKDKALNAFKDSKFKPPEPQSNAK